MVGLTVRKMYAAEKIFIPRFLLVKSLQLDRQQSPPPPHFHTHSRMLLQVTDHLILAGACVFETAKDRQQHAIKMQRKYSSENPH